MFFSVYIPLYNAERYIKTAIESVLAQTFSDFELVIINDASTDGSMQIVKGFAQADSRIRVINKPINVGVFHTRLTAFGEVQGDYIVSLDADDILDSYALETLYEIVSQEPDSDIIYFKSMRFEDSEESKILNLQYCKKTTDDNLIEKTYCEGKNLVEYQKQLIVSHSLNAMWCKMVRKELLVRSINELNSLPRIASGDDIICTLYGSQNAKKVVFINPTLYFYRVNKESLTHRMNGHEFISWLTVMEQREKFISLWHLEEISFKFLIYQRKALAKLLVYNPYVINDDAKKKYYDMLTCILSDTRCKKLLEAKGDLSPVWAVPLWLLRGKHFGMLFAAKQCCGMIRRFLQC